MHRRRTESGTFLNVQIRVGFCLRRTTPQLLPTILPGVDFLPLNIERDAEASTEAERRGQRQRQRRKRTHSS